MKVNVSIDPGVKGCGLAIWFEKNLVHAEYTGALGGQAHPLFESIPGLVKALEGVEIDTIVIEKPKVYNAAQQMGDQRDLINLAITVGAAGYALADKAEVVLIVEPWEWKMQTPKAISNKRTKAALMPEEHAMVQLPSAASLHHNVWDAIGIGLWRFDKNRGPV